MGILKIFTFIILISCSKISYVAKQGYGQVSIELSGIDNNKVLKDKNIDEKHKEKIKKIIKYKEFFYKYFNKKPNAIYTETTFLDRNAVSYLVIASKFFEVKALRTNFPIVGEFPYLGFYSLKDAKKYQERLESRKFYTYLRPVLAYSTLNKLFFKDNILSTFFKFNDFDLADLIFHELTHTIFFLENNVSFNESLADYIAFELTKEYFELSKNEEKEKMILKKKYKELAKLINRLVVDYKQKLDSNRPKNKREADKVLEKFLKENFLIKVEKKCSEFMLKNCWPLKRKWNNASFTAFLTYNSKKSIISQIREKHNLDLVSLLNFLEVKKEEFEKSKRKDFIKFLTM